MGLTRVVTLRKKGQLTIPDDVRSALGLEEGQPLWLVQQVDGIMLTPHDPRQSRHIAETAAVYTAVDAEQGAAPKWADGPPSALRLRDLVAILEDGPHLTTEEADAYARDLADIVSEANRGEVEDPWAS